MEPERWRRIQQLFEASLERSADERDAWLAEATVGDSELKEEVLSLLAADTGDDRVASVVSGAAEGALVEAHDMAGRLVGPYRIVRELGRGGMGAVYLAERADGQFEQRVAIKVVRERLARPDLVERFRAERQILARLEHPHIARLLDGGTTDEGSPYVVMEHVDGQPLDRYCDDRDLGLRARLDLFLGVCDAVHYAHRNLVVHRDLKPSNVLVTVEGVPKLLDFGVARLLDPNDAARGGTTRTVARMMTPEYASPEQVRGEPVSTATDVYSLGVVLYELLTGTRPYRGPTTTPAELERAICEEQPERPGLRGDLDNIVLKALRKEPERRYASAAELADDIRRHLEGLPVQARPSTWAYRTGKFVRRHKLGVAAASLAAVGLLGGAVAATVGLVRARAAEREATAAAATSDKVIDLMVDMFESDLPGERQGRDLTLREVLDRGSERVRAGLDDEPLVRGRLLQVLGRVQHGLGRYAEAEALFRETLEEFEAAGAPATDDRIATLTLLGRALNQQGEYDEALEVLQASLGLAEPAFGSADDRTIEAMKWTGSTLRKLRRYDEADAILRRALELVEQEPDRWWQTQHILKLLAIVVWRQGDHEGSLRFEQRALQLYEEHDPDNHLGIAGLRSNMVASLAELERFDEAAEMARAAIEVQRRIYSADHPLLLTSEMNLGLLLNYAGDHDGALEIQSDVFRRRIRALGPNHPDTALSAYNLAVHWARLGDVGKAVEMLRDAVDRGLVREIDLSLSPFDSVRDHPEFNRLVEVVHSRL